MAILTDDGSVEGDTAGDGVYTGTDLTVFLPSTSEAVVWLRSTETWDQTSDGADPV